VGLRSGSSACWGWRRCNRTGDFRKGWHKWAEGSVGGHAIVSASRVGAAIVAVLAVAAWGAGGAGAVSARRSWSPAAFALGVVRLVVANNYADAWQALPAIEKASVPRALYVNCEQRAPIPGRLARVRVIRLQRTGVSVPGLPRTVLGYSVTVQTTIAIRNGELVTTQMVVPVVIDAGRLAWILRPERFAAYRHGHCLHQPPPA
jgi:hypothetical protein